ncbi:MAG: response regulator transcription factor [Ilumatobacteraceae bacterium]
MRVLICDDAPLVREGIARLLADFGFDVVGVAGDAGELHRQVADERPDAVIVDIRMPPTFTDEGIVAAQRIRSTSPGTVVLVLSNHVEARYAARLMGEMPDGLGYLLKERVANVGAIIDALERMRHGECVIDSTIIATLLNRRRPIGQLETLSAREYEVLQLMAEGLANRGIAERLVVAERTVEGHVANVFSKLDLTDDPTGNRRVLAVLRFLQRR